MPIHMCTRPSKSTSQHPNILPCPSHHTQTGWLVTCANLGDSRCVIDNGLEVMCLTDDHRVATNQQERRRVEHTGALIAPVCVSGMWVVTVVCIPCVLRVCFAQHNPTRAQHNPTCVHHMMCAIYPFICAQCPPRCGPSKGCQQWCGASAYLAWWRVPVSRHWGF